MDRRVKSALNVLAWTPFGVLVGIIAVWLFHHPYEGGAIVVWAFWGLYWIIESGR